MPSAALTQNNSNSTEAYAVEWLPLIVPALKKGWANHHFKLPDNQPAPKLKDWLALLHIAAANPNKLSAYLAQLLSLETQPQWATLTDLLALTFEAAQSEADKLTAEDWQTLLAIQNRIHNVAIQAAASTEIAHQQSAQQRHVQEQALIYESIIKLGTGLDTDTVLKLMSQKMAEAMHAGACVICRVDADANTVTALAKYSSQQPDNPAPGWRKLNASIPVSKDPIAQQALSVNGPVVSRANAANGSDKLIWQTIRVDGNSSWNVVLALPLGAEQGITGLVEIYDGDPNRTFSDDEILTCRILATQTMLAMERAQQFDETLKRLGEVSMLYTMAQQLSSSLDLKHMLDTIVTSLRQIIGCRACCIFLVDDSDQYLEIKAADGLKPQWRDAAKLKLGEGVAGLAAAEARTIYLPDTKKDPDFIFFDEEVRSLMVVPLMAQGRVIGAINVDHNQPDAFGPTQERLLTIAAAQAGVTIENARLFAEISAEQQQTQAIIQHMADGLLLIDSQGVIRRCNYTLATMLGLKRSEIIGQNVNSTDLHPNLADITASFTHRARTGVLAKDVTIETPRPKALQVFATTVIDDQNNPVGEVRLVHDVTQERELEQLKDDFFSTISHELRTPLFSIQGFAQIMLEEKELDQPTQEEFLKTIRRQAAQLGEMVNNLLDISKLDEDKLVLEKAPLSLLDIINQTILTLQGFAHQQKVKLVPNLPAQLPGIVGDKQRLGQVLTNLIGNAIKFSEVEDAITIIALANEKEIIVQVRDNGIGIPAEDLESVFSRYYQASSKSERSAMGSGLGLHIAKKIVEGHGGRIWAESEDGQGSTFSFSVPVTYTT